MTKIPPIDATPTPRRHDHQSLPPDPVGWRFALAAALATTLGLAACGGNDDGTPAPAPAAAAPAPAPAAATPAPAPAPQVQQRLLCDETMKTQFVQADTTVLLVKAFKKGEALILSGTAGTNTPTAGNDLCFVKLQVGPGNAGPAGAPSTSPGIGIEVWLPTKENWNKRIHVKGGGGWAGGGQTTLTSILPDSGSAGSAARVAGVEGAVSATTDTGHSVGNGSFAMNPDGTINTVLWKDFAERGIHEMAVKTKALALAYYGEPHKFAYFNGFSTGGRQGMKEAQVYPDDFDGILAGAPVMNWTRFITYETYPQVVQYRDLNGVLLTTAQHDLVGAAAVAACDLAGTTHLGYVLDPAQCRYDPTKDVTVLCTTAGGTNTTTACVNQAQAQVFNKVWYGMTPDGSVPSPAADNGMGIVPANNQRWYGLTRGASLTRLIGATPFTTATDLVALELQDPTIATSTFVNARGNGASGYKNLSYAQLDLAYQQGLLFQPLWANINTDNPDLTAFRARGGKLLSYHGLADTLVPPMGTVNYYNRAAVQMGGTTSMQNFYRLYMVPGMFHGFGNGSAVATANPPLPNIDLLYGLLTDWVEKGVAPPTKVDLSSDATISPVKTRPICLYPLKPTYTSGDANVAASYSCS